LEFEIEHFLRVVVSQDIMSIAQRNSVVGTLNLQTEHEPHNDMQQKIKQLQAQLGDQKGKCKDTLCVLDTLYPLSRKLENENVELEFQVLNYVREIEHLKTTYKNPFDSISVTRAQTKTMILYLVIQTLVNQSPHGIFINQSSYVLEILKKYGMETCDPVGTPMEIKDKLDLDQNGTPVDATKYHSMIGALITRLSQPRSTSMRLKGSFAIFEEPLIWVSGEKLVSWSSKRQDCIALSTAKAEYVSLSACCAQIIWMRTQLTDYGYHFNKIPIYCDSKSAIAISYNPVQHSRTKHIAVLYHFIKEHIEKGTIELYFVKTHYQLANLFTKALPVERFNYLVHHLGMRSLSPQELERLAKSQ
ncbi:hypothetical protein Tco_0640628, partial [Tanacetum coccineum]